MAEGQGAGGGGVNTFECMSETVSTCEFGDAIRGCVGNMTMWRGSYDLGQQYIIPSRRCLTSKGLSKCEAWYATLASSPSSMETTPFFSVDANVSSTGCTCNPISMSSECTGHISLPAKNKRKWGHGMETTVSGVNEGYRGDGVVPSGLTQESNTRTK